MSVSVISRPRGYVLGDTEATGTISEYYSTLVLVTTVNNHGLSTGDVVYIKSRASEYNGFWSIEVQTPKTFVLMLDDGSFLQYTVDAAITYRVSSHEHAWSCAYLPIVYRLNNNRWPNNFVDTVRTFSSYVNDNGYVRLTVSGSLGSFQNLDKVKINNAGDEELDGVYTIIGSLSGSQVTIDLAYDFFYLFTGANVQLYKDNYNIVVKIHGGLDEHTLRSYNGSVLLSTLRLKPDSDNEVKFSVHEFIRSTVHIKNNLLLSALPNNTDAFTQFYIEYGESYDTSDGTIISTFDSSLTSDSDDFVGYAAAAKLPFKNVYSGYLSDYVMINNLSKFLTLFSIPVFFAGSSCSDCGECYISDALSVAHLSSWTQEQTLPETKPWTLGSNPSVFIPISGSFEERTSYMLKGVIQNPRSGKYNLVISLTHTSSVILLVVLHKSGLDIASTTIIASIDDPIVNMSVEINAGLEIPDEIRIRVTNTGLTDQTFILTNVSLISTNSIKQDSPCHHDLSFILDYSTPSIPGISSFDDIGIIGNNPMTGDPFENRPWTSNPGGLPPDQHITLPDSVNPSNWLAADIENPPSDFVHHFRVSANGTTSSGGFAGQINIQLYEKATNTYRGQQVLQIPDGIGLSSDVNITATGYADQVRIFVYAYNTFPVDPVMTITQFIQKTSAYTVDLFLKKEYANRTDLQPIEYKDKGLYRVPLDIDNQYESVDVSLVLNDSTISETKTIEINSECGDHVIKMSWLNNLGGFEYWTFKSFTDHLVSIGETGTTSVNVIPSWPSSYGEFADTEKRRETFRESTNQVLVRSQSLTQDQADAIAYIKSSPLVQIFNTVYDKRTVIVDKDSFMVYRDNDKDFKIQFTITYTDDIPSQTV